MKERAASKDKEGMVYTVFKLNTLKMESLPRRLMCTTNISLLLHSWLLLKNRICSFHEANFFHLGVDAIGENIP